MRAMILAAGRGQRMGALTEKMPKPLLQVGDRCLIEYSILNLERAGVKDIVINVSYLAELIKEKIGDGSRYGVSIAYSEEKERLETGGGILQALPLLGPDPFYVVSCDIVTDLSLNQLPKKPQGLAHLVMVENPSYHPQGDFGLVEGKIDLHAKPALTFASIAVLHPALFDDCLPGTFPLTKLLFPAIQTGKTTGEHFKGLWYNVGTPEDIQLVNQQHLSW